jgi:hypothetical protein
LKITLRERAISRPAHAAPALDPRAGRTSSQRSVGARRRIPSGQGAEAGAERGHGGATRQAAAVTGCAVKCAIAALRGRGANPGPLLHRAGPTEGELDASRRRLPALGAARYCRRTSRWHRLKPGSEPPSSDGASLSRQEEARATASYHEWAWTSLRAARFPAARALASHM